MTASRVERTRWNSGPVVPLVALLDRLGTNPDGYLPSSNGRPGDIAGVFCHLLAAELQGRARMFTWQKVDLVAFGRVQCF